MYMSFVAGVNGEGIEDIYPLPRNTYAALSLALLVFSWYIYQVNTSGISQFSKFSAPTIAFPFIVFP